MANHRFTIRGSASPDLPLRVLNLFAQRDLAVERVVVSRENAEYVLDIEHHGLSSDKADTLIEKLRAIVLVSHADMRVL